MPETNILFTGITGFLGKIVSEKLQSMGYNVDGLKTQDKKTRVDISEPFELDISHPIQGIIHAAGKAHTVPKSEAERKEFYNINYEGTKNLCHALDHLDPLPQSFVFISTVAVYGVDEGTHICENYALNGTSPYAESKIWAEQWLIDWARERDIALGILRLPLVVGPNPLGNLGAMLAGIKSGKYLSIGKADARKSMVWAEDIANIIPAVLKSGGVYNLTDGIHPTFGELERALAVVMNKSRPMSVPSWTAKVLAQIGDVIGNRFPINSERLKKITSTLIFDDQKAREKLGWNPTPVLSKISQIVEK